MGEHCSEGDAIHLDLVWESTIQRVWTSGRELHLDLVWESSV